MYVVRVRRRKNIHFSVIQLLLYIYISLQGHTGGDIIKKKYHEPPIIILYILNSLSFFHCFLFVSYSYFILGGNRQECNPPLCMYQRSVSTDNNITILSHIYPFIIFYCCHSFLRLLFSSSCNVTEQSS